MPTLKYFDGTSWKALPTGGSQPIQAAGYRISQYATGQSVTGGAFTTIVLPAAPIIEPASAFVQNADNSVTVAESGWYTLAATASPQVAGTGSHLTIGTAPNTRGSLVEAASPPVSSAWGTMPCAAGSAYIVAGTKIYVCITLSATATVTLTEFSIARVGGPKGDTGGNATVAMDTWHIVGAAGEPAFQNSWVNEGTSGFSTLSFRKDPLGKVMLRGGIKNGTVAQAIFTLPVGYRPSVNELFVVGASPNGAGILRVYSNGYVALDAPATNAWVFIDVVEFDTESVTAMPTGPQGPKGDTGGNATVPMDTWHIVGDGATGLGTTFLNSWAVSSGNSPRFRKDPLGKVSIAGQIQGGATGTTAFILPVGYRPPAQAAGSILIPMIGASGVAASAPGYVQIYTATGEVRITNQGTVGSACYLDNVEFDTETVTAMPTGPQGPKGDTGGNATVTMDTWHSVGASGEPTFQNSWVNFGAGYGDLQFRKDPLGKVFLRGLIKSGTVGPSYPIFVIPAGYRPANERIFDAIAIDAIAQIRVQPNGNVFAQQGSNSWLSFDGIVYDTDTVTAMPTGPAGPKGDPGGSATVPIEEWKTVGADGGLTTFGSGWATHSAGYEPQYRKRPDGVVEVRGIARGGIGTTAIFTLPAGYRPVASAGYGLTALYFPAYRQDAANVNVVVFPDGRVVADATTTAAQWFSLTSIRFSTNQATFPTGPQGPKGDTGGNATVPMDAWHYVGAAGEPAFVGTWSNYSGSNRPLRFRKDPLGRVWLNGIVKGGATPSGLIFTLPAGYANAGLTQTFGFLVQGGTLGYLIVSGNAVTMGGGANHNADEIDISWDTDLVTAMPTGPQGPKGDPGGPVPTGGITGDVLRKTSSADGAAAWASPQLPVGHRMIGPFSVTTPSIAGNGGAAQTSEVTHNIGHTRYTVLGGMFIDNGWGYLLSNPIVYKSNNTVSFNFRNNGTAAASITYEFYIMVQP